MKLLGLAEEDAEMLPMLKALAGHIEVTSATDASSFARALYELNAKILRDLRETVEAAYLKWASVYEQGQQLLETTAPGVGLKVRNVLSLSREQRARELRELFPEGNATVSQANMLRYLMEEWDGRPPAESTSGWTARFKEIYRRLGGLERLQAAFVLHRQGVCAAILLYLIDAGANVSSALNLTMDCERPDDNKSLVIIDTIKPRVSQKPIYDALPIATDDVSVTAVAALRGVRAMTAASRQRVDPTRKDVLFLHWWSGEARPIDADTLRRGLRYIIREAELPYAYRPSGIRGAVAIKASSESDARGSLEPVGLRMKHAPGSTSTPIYALRLPLKLLLEQRMRVFQDSLQIAFASHTTEGMRVIGIEDESRKPALDQVMRTGLGPFCAKDLDRAGQGAAPEQGCNSVGDCPGCDEHVVVVELHSLADAIATRDVLLEKETELAAEDPYRWEKTWVELLAFSTVYVDKVRTSAFAHLIPKATRLADSMRRMGFNPTLLRP